MPHKILLTTICPSIYPITQLALYYLKSYFQQHYLSDLAPATIDINVFPWNQKLGTIAKDIIKERPEIVGFACYVWNIEQILKVAGMIKKGCPKIKIMLGGPEVSPRPEEILRRENSIDIIVRGEGEQTFVELIRGLLHQQIGLAPVKGISYRIKDEIFSTPARAVLNEMGAIPSPYLSGLIALKKGARVLVQTMRGCPDRCHYCYEHKMYGRLRYFSLSAVEQELKAILSQQPAEVFIIDSTFNANCVRAKKILRIFITHNRGTALRVALRGERLDVEMVRLLRRANTGFIEIGIQSTDRKVLKLANRTLNQSALKQNIRLLTNKKIFFQTQLIDGLPGNSYAKIKKSVDWLCQLHVPIISIIPLSLLPGTYLRRNARCLKIKYAPDPPYDFYKSDSISPTDLQQIRRLTKAIAVLYNLGFLQQSIYALKQKTKISFSDIFEEWAKWRPKDNLSIELLAEQLPRFVKHLCNKNRAAYKEIYPALKNDLACLLDRVHRKERVELETI